MSDFQFSVATSLSNKNLIYLYVHVKHSGEDQFSSSENDEIYIDFEYNLFYLKFK